MSAIPPIPIASILQTSGAQARTTEQKARERDAAIDRAVGDGFKKDLIGAVEQSDADSQVFADAEGAGSQGRTFSDNDDAAKAPAEDSPQDEQAASGGLDVVG